MRLSEVRSRQEEQRTRLDSLTGGLHQRREAHAGENQTLRDEETQMRELRTQLDSLTQGLADMSLKERELALELTHLVEQIRERHQTELLLELHSYHFLKRLDASAETRLKDLKGQVERMGEINLTAIDEHADLSKRFEFLSTQKKDLESSMQQLKEAIQKIDQTSRERFEETFTIVNEKFQQVFPRLFGGGRAGLILTDAPPGGEPGVEIVAQPPGKKLQSVTLLSGGEKALTAVSLIFAIFLIKPTPFCLLDEVDAPLDEGNVGRYNDMVREMSKQSQFIIITHNKRTMEVSDTLYGVTMEEPGISKLVSVRLKEAVPAANDNQVA
jgi:chromosome segregation protein